MIEAVDVEISKALNVLGAVNEEYRFQQICKLNGGQKEKYKALLEEFERLNNVSESAGNIHHLKGKALEKLVKYLLQISGGIFEVDCNLHTSTNEIDDVVTLTPKGRILLSHGLVDKRIEVFLGECKNHHTSVNVTYIGKFCSLLLTNQVKLGIMFSYHGVSGCGWENGAGLIKKFYLHKEKLEDRYCIVDFSVNEFRAILKGKNILGIIEEHLKSLQFDTDYSRYLSRHPAE